MASGMPTSGTSAMLDSPFVVSSEEASLGSGVTGPGETGPGETGQVRQAQVRQVQVRQVQVRQVQVRQVQAKRVLANQNPAPAQSWTVCRAGSIREHGPISLGEERVALTATVSFRCVSSSL